MADSVRARPSEQDTHATHGADKSSPPSGEYPSRMLRVLDLGERFVGSGLVQLTCFCVFFRAVVVALGLGFDEYLVGMTAFIGLYFRLLDAIATEARRAATTGAVHEGAAPQGDRPNTGTNPTPQSDERIGS